MTDSIDYYAVLGVLPTVDQSALAAVYRALAKKYHPDLYAGNNADAEVITKQLNEAYGVLGDPTKRAAYDRQRRERERATDDYQNQRPWDASDKDDSSDEVTQSWRYVARYHPEAQSFAEELKHLSPSLAFAFRVAILEAKSAGVAEKLYSGMKQQFLQRYFGSNPVVHDFVVKALIADRRDVALEVNKAIKVVGDPPELTAQKFLQIVRKVTEWDEGGGTRPPGPSAKAHDGRAAAQAAVDNFPIHMIIVLVVVVIIGLAFISVYYK